MALAEPRKRMKLSHDPNNTKWTRDTGGFGHKIMTAQGWQPGEYLGAKDAAHAEFHTAANASHIRVFLKDDNLGLGAKRGSGLAEGECVGLDAFQALLGRLNGKNEDELEKEQKSREDLKRAIYTEQKWGSVRFVKGGFLIGDKIQKLIDGEAERLRTLAKEKLSTGIDPVADEGFARLKKSKRKKDQVIGKGDEIDTIEGDAAVSIRPKDEISERRSEGKSKRNGKEEKTTAEKAAKRKRKKERASRRAGKSDEAATDSIEIPKERKKSKRLSDQNSSDLKAAEESLLAPSASPSSTLDSPPSTPQHFAGNRHAVRARFIAHKKLAHMDNTALDQIFMIKR